MSDNDNRPIYDLFDLESSDRLLLARMNPGERILYQRNVAEGMACMIAAMFCARCRTLAGINQAELAYRLGLPIREIERIESAHSGIPTPFGLFCAIARVCDIRLSINTEKKKPIPEVQRQAQSDRLRQALVNHFGESEDE